MAKLYFRYGAMNAGKTTILLQTAHNYEENNKTIVLIKPAKDTKGENKVESRIGLKRDVDLLIDSTDSIIDKINDSFDLVDCILVDEAQFLTKMQVDELFYIAKLYNIPVLAFGLRTDFRTDGFEGSERLLELADELEEMPTICNCGQKARFNARKVDDEFTIEGDSVVIDGANQNVKYIPLCGNCYVDKVLKLQKKFM